MPELEVLIKVHPHFEGLSLPEYKTHGSSGMDLLAACTEPIVLHPGDRALIPTGLSVAIPEDYEAQLRPRSGLALKFGVGLPNSPGTIDSDYRGEIKIILINYGREDFTVTRGMRIAQVVIAPVVKARLLPVDNLDETHRASGGFGHTGLHH
ncbi:MAG: dUTP diphosphatase [Candidatus Omnitrophota bacterium]|nr:dUTP diphosphatase [Candidatus Omnitrophota bacterium]